MTVNPLISVVAPTFNTEKYIVRFINCIQNQTYCNWELILIDDGSTDSTVSIIENYSKNDNRIILKIRDRDPKGADTCRNIGQSLTNGKYIIIFDSDDIVEPWCFQQRVEYMENHPDVDFSTFVGESVISEDPDVEIQFTGKQWGIPTEKDVLKCFLTANYPYAVWNNIYKSDIFKTQLWDEKVKVYQDFDFIVTTLLGNYKHSFAGYSKPDYLYCVGHPNAITAKYITDDKYESTIYLFNKTINRLISNGYSDDYIQAYKKFFLLQYERIALQGNEKQLIEFSNFVFKIYPKNVFRIKLCTKFLTFFKNSKRSTKRVIVNVFLHPRKLIKKLSNS